MRNLPEKVRTNEWGDVLPTTARGGRTDAEGAVLRRRARSTGTEVALFAPGTQVDASEGWMTLCLRHGGNCMHLTRTDAIGWLSHPDLWCEWCMGNFVDDE